MKANITIYVSSEFMGNIVKYEGTLIETKTIKYAQYDNAPQIDFIPAGKRKAIRVIKPSVSTFLILDGIGHPSPDQMYKEAEVLNNGVSISEGRYASFDDRWSLDFDTMIDKYIQEKKVSVVADYRESKGFNSYKMNMPVNKRDTYEEWEAKLKSQGVSDEKIKEINRMNF